MNNVYVISDSKNPFNKPSVSVTDPECIVTDASVTIVTDECSYDVYDLTSIAESMHRLR